MPQSTLLGHLARFASFTTQSEVLCTQGLAYLLETYKEARTAMADAVGACTSIEIDDSLKWIPEAVQKDGGRPDLEAQTADEGAVPVVKIEAKLGAELLAAQLKSYAEDLLTRNGGETALLVLVPNGRVADIPSVIEKAFRQLGSDPWRVTNGHSSGVVIVSVISWDELFTALQGGVGERFRHELEQLQSMYRELISDFIAPLASEEDLREWRSSKTDFLKLVDQVTRRLTNQHRVYPMQTEPIEQGLPEVDPSEYRFRYVCPCASNAKSCFSIGVRDSFAKPITPIWMRFHKETGDFSRIRQRIESSNLKENVVDSSGHIWLPLTLELDESGEEMIQSLIEQAERVLEVAYSTD